jgi:YegS/Rv2252/BmrU family lipid kinase
MSQEKKQILALINPISGTANKDYLPETIRQVVDSSIFDLSIRFTQRPNHAYQLAKEAAGNGYYGVIAVGGDGTVNETASALCDTNTALGIVPNGSGNGLARHLDIPMDINEALEIINNRNIGQYDYCTANDHPFFCTCGVGFDAQVSAKFAKSGKRGPLSYVKSAVSEYLKYRPQSYRITSPEGTIAEKAFIIACGNASQYGNNAYIAPNADMQDGLIDVTVILPITPLDTAMLGILLFSRHIDQDTNIISFRTPSLTIERDKSGIMHLDGETMMMPEKIEIRCHHLGLKVFTPAKSRPKVTIFNTIESGFWDFVNAIRSELNV